MAQQTIDIIQLTHPDTGDVFYPQTHADGVIGLGTAAKTNSTAYATSTQGSHADSAYNLVIGNKSINTVLAGPVSGSAGAATFRKLVAADIPNLDWSKITSGKPTTIAGYGITDAKFGTEGTDYIPVTLGSVTKNVLTAHQSLANYLSRDGGSMNNINVVTNLNADLLDGVHSTGFGRIYSSTIAAGKAIRIQFSDGGGQFAAIVSVRKTQGGGGLTLVGNGYAYNVQRSTWAQISPSSSYEWSVPATDSITTAIEIYNAEGGSTANVYVLVINTATVTFTAIDELTTTGGNYPIANIYSNVASASKLADSHTLWGQSFDGTQNVSGNMTSVGSITMNGAISGATTGAFSSNVTIGGTLSTTGKATLNSLEVTTNAAIKGSLSVTSNATLGSKVYLGTSGTAHTGWSSGQYLQWDDTNKAWHLIGNFYADGFVSSGGLSTGSGTSGIDEAGMWMALDATNEVINVSHIPNITTSKISDLETWITSKGYVTSSGITSVVKGTATSGGNISTSGGTVTIQFPTAYSLPIAKADTLGGIKVGSGLAINATTGVLSATYSYTLPLATNGTRGGIQIGYTESGTNYAVKLSSEKAYVTVPWTDTKNTAGSTDTSSKIFLIGATSQAANPQTYSDNEVYVTSGTLTTNKVQIGGTAVTVQYNSTDKCVEFIFS